MARVGTAAMFMGIENYFGGDLRGFVEAARMAEAAGVDTLVFFDHVVMGERTDRYPFGKFPVPPEYPWPEPMTMMAVVAGATQRIRLSTGVLIAPLRPAVLLAKMAATLDVMSGGRLDLGVGTGWQREEYESSGIPFEDRTERMWEQLRACKRLWAEAPVTLASKTVSLERIYCRPAPAQPGGVPLWFGMAATEANAARIAELGIGWVPISSDMDVVARGTKKLRCAFEKAGRDPAELRVRMTLPTECDASGRPDLERSLARIPDMIEAGATDVAVPPGTYVRAKEELGAFFARIARAGREA